MALLLLALGITSTAHALSVSQAAQQVSFAKDALRVAIESGNQEAIMHAQCKLDNMHQIYPNVLAMSK